MKRIIKVAFIGLIICSIPIVTLTGQEKRNEKHIKVVVDDKSGSKTELDTLLKEGAIPDSIKIKDGKVICIGKHGVMAKAMMHGEGHNCDMSISVNSEKKGKDRIVKKITVISDDSTKILKDDEEEGVIVVNGGKHFIEGKGGDVMVWSSDETGSNGKNIIYINEGKEELKNGEKVFNLEVRTDDSGKEVEKTKYVLAKDGMVISIEGDDEAKVKDLVNDIESKMGVNKAGTTAKPAVKEETKKPLKK